MINKLRNKQKTSLRRRLREAVLRGKIHREYICPAGKKKDETNTQYIQRLRETSAADQFIEVTAKDKKYYVSFGVPGPIVTKLGTFFMVPAEVVGGEWGVHYCLFYPDFGKLKTKKRIALRIGSGCYSGMVLGDTTCDCTQQFRAAQEQCIKNGSGMLMEIPSQDGRGWGEYKMAVQRIMAELDSNTIQAASSFYGHEHDIDRRTYDEAAIILKALGFGPRHVLDLATNNPFRIKAFRDFGFKIGETIPTKHKTNDKRLSKNIRAKLDYWKRHGQGL